MTGYPYDPATSFLREPGYWVHDAFGHVGADDAGKRTACFRTIPHTGLDVSSKTPSTDKAGQRRTPVLAPVSGTIVRTGSDAEAGNFHIIKADGYAEWWIGGHHSAFVARSGRVERGDTIARMGDTGGAQGVHTHWTVATSLAGALAYVDGWVQYRNGRSVGAWAAGAIRGRDQKLYTLLDPYPLFIREWAAEERRRAQVDVGGVTRGDYLELSRYRSYDGADLASVRNGLLSGTFEVLAIDGGNFQIKVPGGTAWVSNKAKAGLVPEEEAELMGAKDDIMEAVRREARPRYYERKSTGERMLVKVQTGYILGPWKRGEKAPVTAGGPDQLLTKQEEERRQVVSDAEWDAILKLATDARQVIASAVADELQRREA